MEEPNDSATDDRAEAPSTEYEPTIINEGVEDAPDASVAGDQQQSTSDEQQSEESKLEGEQVATATSRGQNSQDSFLGLNDVSQLVDFQSNDSPMSTHASAPGFKKFPLTIEISELAGTHEPSGPDLSPRSCSVSAGSDASREDSTTYSNEASNEVSSTPSRSREVEEGSSRRISTTLSEEASDCFQKIIRAEEQYVQMLNVAKEHMFLPLSKNHSAYKVDPKSARGLLIFGLSSELQALQAFHSNLARQNIPSLIDSLCVPDFYLGYLKYGQEFRTRMEHIQDQARRHKPFQTLIDSPLPPNMDDVDPDETLFSIFFRPILHLSQLQYFFFRVFSSSDINAPWFAHLEKLVRVLWNLKSILVHEMKILSQDEVQIHDRKEIILKMVSLERRVVFGVEAKELPSISSSSYISPIPSVLIGLTEVLYRNQGFTAKGLFRIAPSGDESDRAYERIGEGEDAADVTEDVFVASNLIKIWFRELPVALFQDIDFGKITDDTTHEEAGSMIQALQEPQCSLALWMLDLCCAVMLEVEVNAMNSKNLAIVFAPNVTPKVVGDPMSEMKLTRKCEHLLTHAIEWRAQANAKFELPSRTPRNRRPSLSTQAEFPGDPKGGGGGGGSGGGGDTLMVQTHSVTRHSLFSVASFKAHLKTDIFKDAVLKRSPSNIHDIQAPKSPAVKSSAGRLGGLMGGRIPPPPPTPKQPIALTICASCAAELPEGAACTTCEGDVEIALIPLSPGPVVVDEGNNDSSERGKKSRFGIFKNVGKGTRGAHGKSPASAERKISSPPPPPAPPVSPLATTPASSIPTPHASDTASSSNNNPSNSTTTSNSNNNNSNSSNYAANSSNNLNNNSDNDNSNHAPTRRSSQPPQTPTDRTSPNGGKGFWSEPTGSLYPASVPEKRLSLGGRSPPPPDLSDRRISTHSKSEDGAGGSSPGHRHRSSADFTANFAATGRLRPKEASNEAATVWKKSHIRVETIGINVQALMSQALSKPKELSRTDLQSLLAELEASKQKVMAELANLEAQP